MFWQDRKNIHRYTLMEEHVIHVRAVLEALRQHGLTAKPSKCVWGAKTLEYLSHLVGNGKVAVPEARVELSGTSRDQKRKRIREPFSVQWGTADDSFYVMENGLAV